jgi:mono/diheme cytochrome c family protein
MLSKDDTVIPAMLKSRPLKAIGCALLLALAGFVVATFMASGEPVTAQQTSSTPTPVPTRRMPGNIGTGEDWIILDLPITATQMDYGHEIYRLVCSACHGDIGQGLTPEWRSTWAPEDQNCWQSKCHAPNHPPGGFVLPIAPAINNLTTSTTFPTAVQLQAYIHAAMPWYKPGGLTDERAWQVTAYVLKLNNIDAGPVLNADTAAKIRLAPESPISPIKVAAVSSAAASTPESAGPSSSDSALPIIAAICAVILLLAGGCLRYKARR